MSGFVQEGLSEVETTQREALTIANPDHLQSLQQGVKAWNTWRAQHVAIIPDISEADLGGANLRGANFSEANLGRANLRRAHLRKANFGGFNRSGLNRGGLNRGRVNLRAADLSKADLSGANLFRANVSRADVSGILLFETLFIDTNLTAVRGLETCVYEGPSTLDHRTLARSGPLPLAFLRGCGLPDSLIEYLPSLLGEPIQYDSLFISYASRDQAFAERLYADLQNKGVRCWYVPEDMKIGDEFRSRIDASIHLHDRLLLILSAHSIKSRWVQKEVETAFEK